VRRCWRYGIVLFVCAAIITGALIGGGIHHVYFDRGRLPDAGPFIRFEFPSIGRVYDANGETLYEFAREYRQIVEYHDLPVIVRDAIIATEDKNFFTHNGFDYSVIPRVLAKIKIGTVATRLLRLGRQDQFEFDSPSMFPQGGSTITQQLVRAYFLRDMTTKQYGNELRHKGLLSLALSYVIGAPGVNHLVRKLEEMRLSVWIEKEMRERFGSKRRVKEELLARYASFIYMGNGTYGFATASEFYFGRALATFTTADADKAAVLAGIAKSARAYAPTASDTYPVLRRRNQILTLMESKGFISESIAREAAARPIQVAVRGVNPQPEAGTSALVQNVLEELRDGEFNLEDLLQGRIQVHSTADARVQRIVAEQLERGLELYEKRHPKAKGLIQGSAVVLRNSDAAILAETGGRRFYNGRSAKYSDFNRATESQRQPGSVMKPIVYLAAFREGILDLGSIVPDDPIGVPDGAGTKWISNYDGKFKGMIPLRQALAESRNAVAIWITLQVGISNVIQTSRLLGVKTALHAYPTTALGASEMNLMELANAYRHIASSVNAQPYVIRKIVRRTGEIESRVRSKSSPSHIFNGALSLIQEGLRGVVRIPSGTGHSLDSRRFPIAVMGKTGTTNEFRDALFVGSTYGPGGITVAVRIGFDDNRSLGSKETGGRVALPVFREIMLKVYAEKLVGPVPKFPAYMEESIDDFLGGGVIPADPSFLYKTEHPGLSGPRIATESTHR
jgi:penicillin-binding protein 1A